MRVVLRPQAIEDLDEIYDPAFSQVIHRIQLLKEFPFLGPPMDGPYSGYRFLTVEPFRVIYRILSNDLIEVLYVRHCKRRLG